MKMITKIAVSALAPVFMAAAVTPAAAQNIVSPPPGTNIMILGIMTSSGLGSGPIMGGASNPGCPFTLYGKILTATRGVIQIDTVVSCKVFTVPIFFRFTTATTGKIDRLEAIGLSPLLPTLKCGATNVQYTWTNPQDAHVPQTTGNIPPASGACNFKIDFIFSPGITV
ncbi:hypothetical protein [Sphingomonas sp.]|uniref:hypothetical protein n=1 Tax=Sphingomonas sp. TaxID=28214 RepID=UPI003D6D664C